MLKVDNEKKIHITRGDIGTLVVSAKNNDESDYTFQKDDVVQLKVMEKQNVSNIILKKETTVSEESTTIDINLTKDDTRIGDLINAPVKYWYEVELNPDSNPITILGYDENGPKEFILYPEGKNESGV